MSEEFESDENGPARLADVLPSYTEQYLVESWPLDSRYEIVKITGPVLTVEWNTR